MANFSDVGLPLEALPELIDQLESKMKEAARISILRRQQPRDRIKLRQKLLAVADRHR